MGIIQEIKKILTEQQVSQIENDFQKAQERINREFVFPEICTELETICMKFFYAYMPISDVASYEMELFHKMVQDTLNAKQQLPWGDAVTGELFLNYVLSYRLNNEDLVDCREQFFDEIFPRIKSMTMEQAAIEVNYWCFEKVTYQSTNSRTISPLGAIRSAYGRCGEESAFMVAALRSVGIPARQCYTPRWAHCDDNHAWVEVWIDDVWHYLGACEPEPVMDKGWFTSPAQRGMLIHARVFSNLVSEPYITNKTPVMTQVNILSNYTEIKPLTIKVTDGNPVEGARVRFELINYGELFPLATIATDKDGVVEFQTGLGDLVVHVYKDSKYMYQKVDMRITNEPVTFDWNNAVLSETESFDIDMCAPVALPIIEPDVTDSMEQKHKEMMEQGVKIRKAYEATFIRGEKAKVFAAGFTSNQDEIEKLISDSNGNYLEIARFLYTEKLSLELRVMLLSSLRKKDLSDITCDILEEHLESAVKYKDDFQDDIFSQFVLCPRAHSEMITEYREYITKYFTKAQAEKFRKNPVAVYDFIEKEIEDCKDLDYATISASPAGLLDLKIGSEISRKILFVAICRTFGIPARISRIDGSIEYYKDGEFVAISTNKDAEPVRDCKLVLTKCSSDVQFEYNRNLTVALLSDGVYYTMGLGNVTFCGDKVEYMLQEGNYRILTSNRMPNGDVLASAQFVKLEHGKEYQVTIALREDRHIEKGIALPQIMLKYDNSEISQVDIVTNKKQVIAWLGEGKEPTEHLLNEMLEQQDEFCKYSDQIVFVLKDEHSYTNKTLAVAHGKIKMKLAYAVNSFDDDVNTLFDSLSITTQKLPLVMVLNEEKEAIFSTSSYNVGTGGMLLKLLR